MKLLYITQFKHSVKLWQIIEYKSFRIDLKSILIGYNIVKYFQSPTKPTSWRSWVCETRIFTKLGMHKSLYFLLSHEFPPDGELVSKSKRC